MKKSTVGKIVDGLLMAPHPVMDKNGNDPQASAWTNFVHQPRIKVAGLITAGFLAMASTDKQPDPLKVPAGALIGAFMLEALRRLGPQHSKSFYFHTSPPPESPETTPGAQMICERDAKFYGSLTLAFGAGATILTATHGVGPVIGTYAACYGTDIFAHFWRAHQVVKGEWTATTTPPRKRVPEEEEKVTYDWIPTPA